MNAMVPTSTGMVTHPQQAAGMNAMVPTSTGMVTHPQQAAGMNAMVPTSTAMMFQYPQQAAGMNVMIPSNGTMMMQPQGFSAFQNANIFSLPSSFMQHSPKNMHMMQNLLNGVMVSNVLSQFMHGQQNNQLLQTAATMLSPSFSTESPIVYFGCPAAHLSNTFPANNNGQNNDNRPFH
jgi:hypothetical protein